MGISTSDVVPAPVDEVFAWHARPGAVLRLLPPWQPLKVLDEASSLRDGTAVLRLPGGYRWLAEHQPGGYVDGERFVDQFVSWPGPRLFRWRHTHEFEPVDATTTRITDTVETPIPRRLLRGTFAYRHAQLTADLASHARLRALRPEPERPEPERPEPRSPEPMTVAVTGSSGLVGTALCAFLSTGGHRVIRLVRRRARSSTERTWQPEAPAVDLLDGTDAVVHLAGASIAGRFTRRHKAAVRDSRIGPTRKLAECAAAGYDGPRVFVAASAVGYYGPDQGDDVLTEDHPRGDGFLADLVIDWEESALVSASDVLRTVLVRSGIALSARGGMLRLLRPLYAVGLGGRLGSGEQWFPWIGIDDLCDIYARAIVDEALSGPVNAVAPEPVRNSELTATLARVMHRPAALPVPAAAPGFLLGREGAREFALAGQRAHPARLLDAGHVFRHEHLEGALRHQLGK